MKPYGVSRTDEAYEAYRAHDKPIPLSPTDKRADRTRKKTARQQAEREKRIIDEARANRQLLTMLDELTPVEDWPTLQEIKRQYATDSSPLTTHTDTSQGKP